MLDGAADKCLVLTMPQNSISHNMSRMASSLLPSALMLWLLIIVVIQIDMAAGFSSHTTAIDNTRMGGSLNKTTDQVPGEEQIKQSGKRNHHFNKGVLLTIIILPCSLGSVMILSVLFWICHRSSSADQVVASQLESQASGNVLSVGPWQKRFNSFRIARRKGSACVLDYGLLQAATNNFSSDNILGTGGFSCVYKARFDEDFVAAVKKLDGEDEFIDQDFQTEVRLMSKIRHPNLVSLLGFCISGKQRFLMYELMQNGSLEDQLYGPLQGSALSWYMRVKIALDAARGLEYLHERCNPPIIHRDFKSSNILLDASFNAKLSDFGLAVLNPGNHENKDFELQGTFGYVAPETLLDGILSEKSDVYAFGVVLLELITGRPPIDRTMPTGCESLVSWASPLLMDRQKLIEIVDPSIMDSINMKHLYQVSAVAALCIQHESSYRPLIVDVVHSLIPLVPVELGGTLKTAESGIRLEKTGPLSFSQYELRSLSSQNSLSVADSRELHV